MLTYEVIGDESGPQIDTIEVTGDSYTVPSENIASTSTSGTRLKVKVLTVEPQQSEAGS